MGYDKNSSIEIKDKRDRKLKLKKVNMNDIMYALFLGNYAGCCMRAGGGHLSSTAPNYIKNKFISAIEILDEGKPVGNTICYLALVNDRPAMILDNISLKPDYRNDDKIGQGFADYAKKMCVEIGLGSIPVYTTSTRQAVRIKQVEEGVSFRFLGSSGEDYIYIDDITESEIISPDFENLEPDDSDGADPAAEISIIPPSRVNFENLYNDIDFSTALEPRIRWVRNDLPTEDNTFD